MATRIDHTTCSHDRTPKARAVCRAQQRSYDSAMDDLRNRPETPLTPEIRVAATDYADRTREARKAVLTVVEGSTRAAGRVTRRTKRTDPALRVADRRMREIREAADQPTWDGARKAARKAALRTARPLVPSADGVDYSLCIQVGLHIGSGRCACGWHTAGF